ncbi:hypothetical protein AAC387_Pa05g2966 [Persea americana]
MARSRDRTEDFWDTAVCCALPLDTMRHFSHYGIESAWRVVLKPLLTFLLEQQGLPELPGGKMGNSIGILSRVSGQQGHC